MALTSFARAVYVIACHMIERHGDRAGDILERFVAANQSQEDIEAKALWADVRVAVRILTSEATRPLSASSSKSRASGSSASRGY
jgi:hypothetical protein